METINIPTKAEVRRAQAAINYVNRLVNEGKHNHLDHEEWFWLCGERNKAHNVISIAKKIYNEDLSYMRGI